MIAHGETVDKIRSILLNEGLTEDEALFTYYAAKVYLQGFRKESA